MGACMYFRFLAFLATVFAVQAGHGRDAGPNVDVNAVYDQLIDESQRSCKESEDSLYREDSEYAKKASGYATFVLATDKYRWLNQHRDFHLRDDDYYFSHLGLRNYDSAGIETLVFDSPLPRAYICAHGTMFIASSFLDPDSPLHLTDHELVALVAHEFVHFRDGHVLLQRAAAKFRDAGMTIGRKPGPLERLTGVADVAALFADEGREFEADRGALVILAAHKVPADAYASMMSKLTKATPPRSVAAAALARRQVCVSRFLQPSQRFFWMTPAARAKIEAEGLVVTNERRGDDRFFLRHANIFSKVLADGSLSSGAPPTGSELIPLTAHDLHTVCAMAQLIPSVQDARAKPLAEALSRRLLDWLGGTGKETLNEIF